jgi:phosphoribosylamine---glycine ligase
MKILLIDVYSSYLDFAMLCVNAGHEVRWFQSKTREGLRSKVGDGIIKKVGDWESSMRWADIVLLADNVKYIHALESWRRKGYPIWGPSVETADWELNRETGQNVLKNVGVKIMESIPFKSVNEAKAFLMANPKRYVSKPNADDNKALSYVSKSARDLMFMLEYWQKNSKVKGDFIFQEFTPGIEVAVGGWVGLNGFVGKFLENFEHKKLMNDDVGVNTGEMGTVLKYVEKSALADQLLRPLEAELIRKGYTGYIDVSVMVSKSGDPLPLEFTCRPGWPLQQILQCLHVGDPVEWMVDALQGRDTMRVRDEVAAGVVMTIPDFPYSTMTKKEVSGYPVYGWEKIPMRHFHPAEMMMGEVWQKRGDSLVKEPGLVTAGDYVCVITGSGDTVCEAKEEAYKNLDRIELPNSPMYRTDIGCRLEKQLPILQEHGYCEEWKY